MKIQVIERKFKSHGNYNTSYKIHNVEYCCEGIKSLPNINLHYEITENTDNYNCDLGMMLVNSITYHDAWDYDDYGYTREYYYKLNCCPICGEKFEVEIIDSIDLTEEYEKLVKEREEVHKKSQTTDSIKKKNDYLKRRQELDQKIESLYVTECFLDNKDEDY